MRPFLPTAKRCEQEQRDAVIHENFTNESLLANPLGEDFQMQSWLWGASISEQLGQI